MAELKRFLNEKELGPMLGVRVKTLQRWRLLGVGPKYKKLRGSVRYDAADVEAWIQSSPSGGEVAQAEHKGVA
jgi:predicted DNA-binding transcriptional regulator AlpA